MAYRLGADFQADWKEELGQWLKTAETFGFLGELVRVLSDEKRRPSRSIEVDPNDKHHLKLHQHAAAAMFCHYFTRTGWGFGAWEPEHGGDVDIDLALTAPDGTAVDLQVKAPDQPGQLVNGRLRDGNFDERVVTALDNASAQLPQPARSPALIAVFVQRTIPMVTNPACLVRHVFGSTLSVHGDTSVYLPKDRFGRFMSGDWNHVAGLVAIDLIRGVDEVRYACTVLLNPKAVYQASPEWFPRSRVAMLEGDSFRWVRGEAGQRSMLPPGTRVVDQLPEVVL